MISNQKLYSTDLDDSLVTHAYKLRCQKESMQVETDVLKHGEVFAFFQAPDTRALASLVLAIG